MLLHVIARGKIGRSPEAELVERYAKRIAWPLRLTELPESGGRIPEPQTPFRTILLDERGDSSSSEDFAELLRGWRDNGIRETRFLIGAADGHSRADRDARRPPARVRQGDLAAPARPRDAARAAVPRDQPACRPSLPSGRIAP